MTRISTRIKCSDNSSDTRPNNTWWNNTHLFEPPDNTDMSKSASSATTEYERKRFLWHIIILILLKPYEFQNSILKRGEKTSPLRAPETRVHTIYPWLPRYRMILLSRICSASETWAIGLLLDISCLVYGLWGGLCISLSVTRTIRLWVQKVSQLSKDSRYIL